jgi:hypothetical protein
MNHTMKEIANAARRIHSNYGAGFVEYVHVFLDGRIELCATRTSCRQKVYIGHITANGKSVRLHGHQTRIGFEQQY